ncbi:MAG: DNA-3-methyladenine glycosylase 2 family protein, partial [Paracoccaceae bacterium]
MTGRIIEGPDDLAEGAAWLAAREPRFAPALALGPLPLRRWSEGFAALLDAILG